MPSPPKSPRKPTKLPNLKQKPVRQSVAARIRGGLEGTSRGKHPK